QNSLFEALTLPNAAFINSKCSDRYATLGDSYLKFAVSQQIVLNFKDDQEDMFSLLRTYIVSNANLAKKMIEKSFEDFIISERIDKIPIEKQLILIEALSNIKNLSVSTAKQQKKISKFSSIENAILEHKNLLKYENFQFDDFSQNSVQDNTLITLKNVADIFESLIGCFYSAYSENVALSFIRYFYF
ncbi:MAG: Dicer-like protein 1, partial [Paramarteilia canceri]